MVDTDKYFAKSGNKFAVKGDKLRSYVQDALRLGTAGKRAAQDELWDVAGDPRCDKFNTMTVNNIFAEFSAKLKG